MIRNFLVFILLLHGLIHLLGFAKAFQFGHITQLTKGVSKPVGLLWLLSTLLFVSCAVLVALQKEWWPLGFATVILSQGLIFTVWSDAKFGSIANTIVLAAAFLAFGAWHFENDYKKDVEDRFAYSPSSEASLVTELDLQPLPDPVQRYLRYAGVLNKPKVKNVKITFEGDMRERGKNWFPFQSEQYNFFEAPTRLFFIKAKMLGVTVPGYHAYKNGVATMEIKLFGLFPIIDNRGAIMNKAETVTIFNDMCLLAPATLIHKSIQWEAIDSSSAKATFTCKDNSISATLYFNDANQLINFVSDDRYSVGDQQQYRFSTPVRDYKNINGYNIMTYGEAVWHYPEGEFVYGKFRLKDIKYNVSGLVK